MKHHLGIPAFKRAVKKGLALPPGLVVHKSMSVRVDAASDAADDRRKVFTISTETVDRDNDTLALKGWKLDAYRANPVVLWGHEAHQPPIGRSIELAVENNALKAMVQFVPADVPIIGETAEMVFRLCDAGFLSACSVGFKPLEYTTAKDRMDDDDWWPALDFTSQELLEWSVVTIPANPDATIDDEERAAAIAAQKEAQRAAAEAAAKLDARRRELRAACF